ncbi:hypothetical protein AB0F14_20905 [Streptomyces tubercidicus]
MSYPPYGPRELGRTGVTVPPLGLGCAPLGNLYRAVPEAQARDVGGVYNSGLLADPTPGAPYNYAPAPAPVLDRARQLAAVCAEFDVPLKAAALRFPFGRPAVAAAVVGAAAPDEMAENARLFTHHIPDALWHTLVARGLLDADLPLPLND